MVTKTLKGIYHNGKIQLEGEVNSSAPMDVVVIFFKEEGTQKLNQKDFSFSKALQSTLNANGIPLSEIVLQQRLEQ